MTIQQMLLGAKSAGGGANLATLFSVNPNSSVTTFCQVLSGTYTCTWQEPTGGWSDFPKGDVGTFISGWGITTADNGGLYKVGTSANGFNDLSSTVTPCSSASSTASNQSGYNAANMTNFSNGNSGAFFGSGGRQQSYNYSHWDAVFSSGFGNNIGFVIQYWGSNSAGNSGYHKTPLIRVVCNGIGRVFAPKGKFRHTNGSPWNSAGRTQCALYPTIYDSPTGNTSTYFDSWTGYTAPSNVFAY